jgi:cysteine-rich repeat protein
MVRGVCHWATALVAAAACQFRKPEDVPSDASPDAPADAPVDAPPDRVVGRVYAEHLTPAGTTEVPFDATIYTVHALIPTADGLQTVTGIGRLDGTFQIDGVPPGVEYFLSLGRDPILTTSHDVRLRYPRATRADAVPATQATPVTVSTTGLMPTGSMDLVTAQSHLGTLDQVMPAIAGGNAQATFDWSTLAPQGTRLLEAARGDDLHVVHYRTDPGTTDDAGDTVRIVAAASFAGVTLVDGVAASVSAVATPPSATLGLTGGLSLTSYSSGHSLSTTSTGLDLRCAARPGLAWSRSDFLRHPIVTITKLDWPNTDATAMPIAGAYPDPYPAAWPRLCQVTHGRARSYRDPGGSRSPRQVFYETRRLAVPSVIGVAPMPPPRDVRIDGRDADFGGHLRADEPHTLTWTGSPLATQYEVTLYRVRPGMPHRIHMAITTPSTKLTLPAEFLTGNDYLVFQVTAIAAQNDVAGGDLLPNGIPLTTAATVSALFRVSSTCGDGQLDVGEDCDARGESATCDVDCTAVTCGDGLRNPTAGELCDPVEDAVNCDADCTPAVCGDGYRNTATEACDDGGTAPGDGCSPTCRVES